MFEALDQHRPAHEHIRNELNSRNKSRSKESAEKSSGLFTKFSRGHSSMKFSKQEIGAQMDIIQRENDRLENLAELQRKVCLSESITK